MGKYTRKCSKRCSGGPGGGEVALMEVNSQSNSGSSAKRRKVKVGNNGELRFSSSKSTRIVEACEGEEEDVFDVSRNSGDDSSDPCRSSGEVPASCCSSNGSITEEIKCSDLEERVEVETTVRFNSDRRESTPTSELKEESGELESSSTTESKPSSALIDHSRRPIAIPPEKTPPAAEIEEFFASAENNLHESFKDKYNFDIVNDVPMKGRFEWIQLKP
ncbi:hypothetical protein OSB04_007414 [Centaurea solstitialis]|uniref:Cyclin-dependent kinase inhibitor n=1 Tax=Centaurea solstitialis TaxID=347529 RepID=A0AA38TLJ3_9ASTR|nr:hypothetical protein OSB04_007414 [Centaurea solstitialis]